MTQPINLDELEKKARAATQRNGKVLICTMCSDSFYRPLYHLKRSSLIGVFCSAGCCRLYKKTSLDRKRVEFNSKYKVNKTSGCFEWVGTPNGNGYGVMQFHGRQTLAHRVSWFLNCGDPGELFVCHKCDNPPCVNPDHLFLGSAADNNKDKGRKGRHPAQLNKPKYLKILLSAQKANTKLTNKDLLKIYKMSMAGIPQKQIAHFFNVGQSGISTALKRFKRNQALADTDALLKGDGK